jgi:hypothetical protein
VKARVIEPWLLAPLERFVRESGARLADHDAVRAGVSSTVTRAVEAAPAAAAGHAASTAEIVKMLDEPDFRVLNHQSPHHGIFLGRFATGRGPLLALVVYGADTSIGLVQLFFEDLVADLEAAAPVVAPRGPVLAANFERDLNESLATLFR